MQVLFLPQPWRTVGGLWGKERDAHRLRLPPFPQTFLVFAGA